MVAFGGAILAAGTFAPVGMLVAAMTNAAHEGNHQAVYTLNQLHVLRLGRVERGVRRIAPGHRLGRAPERHVPNAARMGDCRDRSSAPRFVRRRSPRIAASRKRPARSPRALRLGPNGGRPGAGRQ